MRRAALVFLGFLFVAVARAQGPATGFPLYGSFENGGFDAVNRQNLNVNFGIPVVSSPGRGINLGFAIVQDSLIWQKSSSGTYWTPVTDSTGVAIWGWKKTAVTGSIPYKKFTFTCVRDNGSRFTATQYSSYAYVDSAGTRHPFSVSFSIPDCTGGVETGYATDGSGYYVDANSPDSPIVFSPGGVKITNDGTLTDPNENFLSKVVVSSSETDWKDSTGRVALKIVTSGSTIQYQVQDTTGAWQTTTLNLQTLNIKTNFGCSGVVEYTGTASVPLSITLPNNKTYSFTYEQTPGISGYYTGRVQRVTLPTGGYYEYTYPGANDSINCTDGTVTNLTRVINDGVSSATWTFVRAPSGSNWTTTVTAPPLSYDAAANQAVYTFNSSGQETQTQIYQGSAGGTLLRTINTTWSGGAPATQVVVLENNQQSEMDTSYDGFGNLLSLTEKGWGSGVPGSAVRTTTLTYLNTTAYTARNIMNRVTRKTVSDSLGAVKFRQDISYDGTSNFTGANCVTGALQHDDANYGCAFLTRGNRISVTTYANAAAPSGGITKNFTYDSLGNLRQADVDCCQQESWAYTATTNFAYPDSVTRGPSGTQLTTQYFYENAYTGFLTSAKDENNQTTSYAYDTMRRLTTITRPDNAQIIYTYDDTIMTVTVAQPVQGTNVVKQTSYFDGLGRAFRSATLDAGNTDYSKTDVLFDPLGRTWKVTNPYTGQNPPSCPSNCTETRFDGSGRVTKTILPDGQQTQYSYSGSTVTVTDPTSKQRKSEIDALGRLVTVWEPDPANGNSLSLQTSYLYSTLDALTSVSQGAQTRTYNYDDLGRLTNETTPEGGYWQFTYTNFGLVSQRTDARGVITTYGYDSLNRPASISYNVGSTGVPATSTVNLYYDEGGSAANALGRLTHFTDGVGSETYTYDQLGRVTQVQKLINSTTYATSYQYNLAGEMTQITYPSGRIVNPSYDAIGRLSQIASVGTNYTSSYAYSPAFQVTGMNYGNGVSASFGYSADRWQLTSLSYVKGTTTLFSLSYGYTQGGGNNGQITSIMDNVDNGRSVAYTYDALYRLKTALTTGSTGYPQWGLAETNDRYGNRLRQDVTAGSGPSNVVTVSTTTNRITDTVTATT